MPATPQKPTAPVIAKSKNVAMKATAKNDSLLKSILLKKEFESELRDLYCNVTLHVPKPRIPAPEDDIELTLHQTYEVSRDGGNTFTTLKHIGEDVDYDKENRRRRVFVFDTLTTPRATVMVWHTEFDEGKVVIKQQPL